MPLSHYRISRKIHNALVITCLGLGIMPAAHANEWEKPPIQFGSFLLFSDITLKERYNDNIYALDSIKTSDLITIIQPNLEIAKNYGRHSLSLKASAEGQIYKKLHDENQINHNLSLEADIEALHNLRFPVKITHNKDHIKRNDSSQIGVLSREPIGIIQNTVDTGLIYEPGNLRLDLIGSYLQKRIPDGETSRPQPNVTSIGKDREKDAFAIEASVTYQWHPNWKPILKGEYITDHYKKNTLTASGFNGSNQDNKTIRILAGLNFDYKGLLTGNILLGRESRTYEQQGAAKVNGLTAQSDIRFSPKEGTQGYFIFEKKSHDDNALLSGVRQTSWKIGLEQELSSRWMANIEGEYKKTDFFTFNRLDDEYIGSASLVYRIKRGLFLQGDMSYTKRESTAANSSYEQNIFTLGITQQF